MRRAETNTRAPSLSSRSRSMPTWARAQAVPAARKPSSCIRTQAAAVSRTRNWFAQKLVQLVRSISRSCSSFMRSAKGNRAMRRLLNQLAHAAVRKRDCYLQIVFKRLSPRLGYAKAVWAIAHRLCRLIWKVLHEAVQYVEYGPAVSALTLKRRKQRLVTQLAKLGYSVQLTPILARAGS